MNLRTLSLLAALSLPSTLHAQITSCPAAAFPYTDGFTGTGSLNDCWTPVVGPATSTAAKQATYAAISVAPGYGVEMFTGLPVNPTHQSIQAAMTWSGIAYPALTLDQQANGNSIAFEPSLNAIYNLAANSGAYPGGILCAGTTPIHSGDTFQLSKNGATYTATDLTTGAVICSADSSLYQGVPGIQVDDRNGTSTIGPVTVTSTRPAPVVAPNNPATATIPVTPGTAYTVTISNFATPVGTPANAISFLLVNVPPSQPSSGWEGTQFDMSIAGVVMTCNYGQTYTNEVFSMSCAVPSATAGGATPAAGQ